MDATAPRESFCEVLSMNIAELNGKKISENTVAAIGFFDGVHKGHRALLEKTLDIAEAKGLKKAVITFDKHPKAVLADMEYRYITPLAHKLSIFERMGFDTAYLIRFDKEKAKLTSKAFIDHYLNGLDTLVCGFDFTFGAKASGSAQTLEEEGFFETFVVREQKLSEGKIGSTFIRESIEQGEVAAVMPYLGRYYSLCGKVVKGAQKGRTIRYPTANIDTGDYLVPAKGVYASRTKVRGTWHDSISSVGFNPTLNPSGSLSVESHLFDFDEDIYGETIETCFIKRIRDELRFPNADALVKRIEEDVAIAKHILKQAKKEF